MNGSFTRARTRKRCILRSLIFGAGTVTKIAKQQHILDSNSLTTTAVHTPYRTKLSNLLKKLKFHFSSMIAQYVKKIITLPIPLTLQYAIIFSVRALQLKCP